MKINRDCEKIYDGVLLQSYVLVFMNVVVFNIFSYVAEHWVLPLFINYFSPPEAKPAQAQSSVGGDLEVNTIGVKIEEGDPMESLVESKPVIGKAAVMFLYFQGFCALYAVLVACLHDYEGQNSWNRYESFYGFLLNSPYMTFVVSSMILTFRLEGEGTMAMEEPFGKQFHSFFELCF
jgi:hypothetical protein